jgi:hypothetical protein
VEGDANPVKRDQSIPWEKEHVAATSRKSIPKSVGLFLTRSTVSYMLLVQR